jgi:hypothetical protein
MDFVRNSWWLLNTKVANISPLFRPSTGQRIDLNAEKSMMWTSEGFAESTESASSRFHTQLIQKA